MSAIAHAPVAVRPMQLIVRCFAELADDQWQAFSIDFGLAAQADSLPEVKTKLDGMIRLYVEEALIGEDRPHAERLLSRKAPAQIILRYYLYRALELIRPDRNGRSRNLFNECLPLSPAGLVA